ncbi:MAG: phosphonopyruvate decarboxylase [bacterium]
MIHPCLLYTLFTSLGFGPYISIPCSILKSFINYVTDQTDVPYYAAVDEGEALGMAAGMHLGGKKPVVMIQNSGLGNMIDPLTSLNLVFNIPTLLLISWRGEPGKPDEPQHRIMGSLMQKFLDVMEIPYVILSEEFEDAEKQIRGLSQRMEQTQKPAAIIIKKGLFESYEKKHGHQDPHIILQRRQAIDIILGKLKGDEILIASTGKISREVYAAEKKLTNPFYVLGSMGCAGSIAFGIAQTMPKKQVVVLDGDGALLMRMGTMATIGHYKPAHVLHMVLDNESHESTGGQKTVSSTVCFGKVARACGYKNIARVYTQEELSSKLQEFMYQEGPHCIVVKVVSGSDPKLGRPKETPEQLKNQFIKNL